MRPKIILSIAGLAGAAVACSIFVGGPDYPQPPVVPSTQSAEEAQAQIDQALIDSAQTGHFHLVISESQLTAYLAARLSEQPTPLLSEPQVVLHDGVARIYGKAQSGLLLANISATARVTLDENGQPQIEITQAEFGPIPMPESLSSGLSAVLQEALTGQVGPAATGFRLDTIEIADGVLTVTGRTK